MKNYLEPEDQDVSYRFFDAKNDIARQILPLYQASEIIEI